MRLLKILGLVSTIIVFTAHAGSFAYAETLKQQTSKLDILPLHYGANNFSVGGRGILIIRGEFNTETAWGGDVYVILAHSAEGRRGDDWKIARYWSGSRNDMLTVTTPHTDEDSIVSVRFMVPQGSSADQGYSDLYLLKAERKYMPNPSGVLGNEEHESVATFTLYKLQRDDFEIFLLHELKQVTTKKKYCNVDWALYKELGVALPDDSGQYVCSNH
jgi:hypothetical protein